MLEKVVSGESYRNKKTGNLYYVLGLGKHTETQDEMVMYVRRDNEVMLISETQIWVRPLELFKEKFEI